MAVEPLHITHAHIQRQKISKFRILRPDFRTANDGVFGFMGHYGKAWRPIGVRGVRIEATIVACAARACLQIRLKSPFTNLVCNTALLHFACVGAVLYVTGHCHFPMAGGCQPHTQRGVRAAAPLPDYPRQSSAAIPLCKYTARQAWRLFYECIFPIVPHFDSVVALRLCSAASCWIGRSCPESL